MTFSLTLARIRIRIGLFRLDWLIAQCERAIAEERYYDAAVEFERIKIAQGKVERLLRRVEPQHEGRTA